MAPATVGAEIPHGPSEGAGVGSRRRGRLVVTRQPPDLLGVERPALAVAPDVVSGAQFGARNASRIATLPAGILSTDMTPDRSRLLAIMADRIGAGTATVVQNWRQALEKQ